MLSNNNCGGRKLYHLPPSDRVEADSKEGGRMYVVDLYFRVRKACLVERMSMREASRVFGLHRDTVRKMLSNPVPPGYRRQRPARRPKLELFAGIIDRILEEDLSLPRKQRHTVKRIFERLREEHGFDGGYTIVKDHVRKSRSQGREMFVPLDHPPGHAQCDFGQAWAVIGGERRRVHYFVMSLPHSDGILVKAYPGETTGAFCDGHVSAFAYLGGVPQSILYDNTKLAVARIRGGGRRERTRVFNHLQVICIQPDLHQHAYKPGRHRVSPVAHADGAPLPHSHPVVDVFGNGSRRQRSQVKTFLFHPGPHQPVAALHDPPK